MTLHPRPIGFLCGLLLLLALSATDAHAYHNPTLGRFISRDPAGYVDGMNLYEYVCSLFPVRRAGIGLAALS